MYGKMLTIFAINDCAIRNNKNAHNKSQQINKYGMNGFAWRNKTFDAYKTNGFS